MRNRKPRGKSGEISDSIWFTVELNEIKRDSIWKAVELLFATPKPHRRAPKALSRDGMVD
jgi:hypothetical protein